MTVMTVLAIAAGCVLLYFGAESLVVGASRIAVGMGFPKAIAGLTLVAVGTSAPELFVNLLSASRGHTEFAMSNISGSNLANLCVGFGICTLIAALPVARRTFGVDLCFLAATPVLVVAMLLYPPLHVLNLSAAGLLTLGLVAYGVSLLRRALTPQETTPEGSGALPLAGGFARFGVGSVLLYAGAEIVLLMSVRLAEALAISEAVIGLTIVAAGTSVPDITASIVATLRKENDIAVGNLLGSNISNILLVLNATLWVAGRGIETDRLCTQDYYIVLALSVVFAGYALTCQRLHRGIGIVLLVVYLGYMVSRVVGAAP